MFFLSSLICDQKKCDFTHQCLVRLVIFWLTARFKAAVLSSYTCVTNLRISVLEPKLSSEEAKVKRHGSMAKWRLTPPKHGEKHEKSVNGRVFKWCGKCGNWTTTHDTSTHTGKSAVGEHKSHFKSKRNVPEANLTAWIPPHGWFQWIKIVIGIVCSVGAISMLESAQ